MFTVKIFFFITERHIADAVVNLVLDRLFIVKANS